MNKNTKAIKTRNKKLIKTGKTPIIGQNKNRNMQQKVYWNSGGGTLTVHEPIDTSKPFLPYGKGPQKWITK